MLEAAGERGNTRARQPINFPDPDTFLRSTSPGRKSSAARPADRCSDWTALVPNVRSVDSIGSSVKGNQRWQDAHPDTWEDADRWLAEALSPHERDSRVARVLLGAKPEPPVRRLRARAGFALDQASTASPGTASVE